MLGTNGLSMFETRVHPRSVDRPVGADPPARREMMKGAAEALAPGERGE